MDAGHVNARAWGEILILKGSQRAGATALADHLMNERDNDHVNILELSGFLSDTLHGALSEAHAISKATRCRQFMFSLSLNPPLNHIATDKELLEAADRTGEKLGLADQPRAIVVHEKEGRRHAHVVWARIDANEMKAINLPHFKTKLRDLSRDLFLDHGWVLPDGLATYGNKSPLNFTLSEWQQAKRQDVDPREIKQMIRQAWDRSDSLVGLQNALEERGYFLARGDRRGFVALDVDGNVHSLPRWMGIKTKDVKAKLGSPDQLESADVVKASIRSKVTAQMRDYIGEIKAGHTEQLSPLRNEHRAMTFAHRQERQQVREGQEQRWIAETKSRSDRLNKGVRGLFDRLSGKATATRVENERDAMQCAKRDQEQRDYLIKAQMKERQELQARVLKLKRKQADERQLLAQSVSQSLRRKTQSQVHPKRHRRNQTPDLSI